ncbi:MAG: hypothetical protein M0R74_02445 [Dehalococcoidia bacterium]|nr:hypothetical protein [Dehalococcoidia bacterium]
MARAYAYNQSGYDHVLGWDPAAEFAARPQGRGWIGAGAALGAVGWLMTWFRRSELGLYLALGTSRGAVLFLLAAECWMLVGAASLIGFTYALAVDAALGHEPGLAAALLGARTSTLAALVTMVLFPLGSLLLVRGSIADLLKDR